MPSVSASSIVVGDAEAVLLRQFAAEVVLADLLDVATRDAELGEVVLVALHVAVEEAAGDVVRVRQVAVDRGEDRDLLRRRLRALRRARARGIGGASRAVDRSPLFQRRAMMRGKRGA